MKYCLSTFQTKRWNTREVAVGSVAIGGNNPIRIQSMTTSSTRDVEATVDQVIRLADSGCEIVRVTVQGMKEAESCEAIKNILLKKGYTTPIVADIHFFPPAAMHVVEFVDKVRINPGNYADKRAIFQTIDYDDDSYIKELEKIEEKFAPLVEKCKKLKKAMRIGTNHGSLSDRIMNRYGDTPQGMVESALEFARICRKYDYHDFLFSMKSSNPQVMILAYRLLVSEMISLDWNYPLHLGVTEAGHGEDGRIKSAIGIGSLLLDGIGDTIRVSLTEDAWNEIDPCKRLIQFAKSHEGQGVSSFEEKHRDIRSIHKRNVVLPKNISMHRDGTVITSLRSEDLTSPSFYNDIGCAIQNFKPKLKTSTADGLIIPSEADPLSPLFKELEDLGTSLFVKQQPQEGAIFLRNLQSLYDNLSTGGSSQKGQNGRLAVVSEEPPLVVVVEDEPLEMWDVLEKTNPSLIFLAPKKNRLHSCRRFFDWIKEKDMKTPVILYFSYENISEEDLLIQASVECGALLCDGMGDGICLEAPFPATFLRSLSFNILQASRMRTSKTEFISCPSCGRTLFNLQEVSQRIRSKTSHLPGVKIAIMGCIVNGPGEMADADFGYVGSKPGMIDLYIGKTCVEKNIHFADADERLIDLIKKNGRWVEPEVLI